MKLTGLDGSQINRTVGQALGGLAKEGGAMDLVENTVELVQGVCQSVVDVAGREDGSRGAGDGQGGDESGELHFYCGLESGLYYVDIGVYRYIY